MSMTIQKAGPAHLEQLEALEQVCFSDPWGPDSLAWALADPDSLWLVALDETGTVTAYGGSRLSFDEADIMNIAVAPACRRQGLGRQLLSMLLADLARRGAKTVTLEVRESNALALALYGAFGFEPVGRRPGYYSHPKEDALLLRCTLEDRT